MRRWCEKCMKIHESAERCPLTPKRNPDKRTNREPYRKAYCDPAYRRNRQEALERTGGRCSKCGKSIAAKVDGIWKMKGGDVHHMKALSEGGGNEVANLAPLCWPCHAEEDARRRRSNARPSTRE